MQFLSWLFNLSVRHNADARRYEKGKISTRIFIIILMPSLVALTLYLEYWSMGLWAENVFWGFFSLILAIIIGIVTTEFCSIYSYFGFKYAILGTIETFINKAEQKRKNKIKQNPETQLTSDTTTNVTEPKKVTKKSPKWLDFIVGILGAVLAIGTVVLMLLLFFKIINDASI
ncbi:MAG: hypothetical protein ACI4PF_03885 [Christensenellales bacterium]